MSLRYDRSHRSGPSGHEQRPFDAERRHADHETPRSHLGPEKSKHSFLSVVVPAKNEAASLPQLVNEIACALRPLCEHSERELAGFEIIIIDDGSSDLTQRVLQELAAAYPELKFLALPESVGQSAATMAGIHMATGFWIVTLDADLQNDPVDLMRFWRALPNAHCAVLGWRVNRQDAWTKRAISFWANKLRNAVLGQSIRDTGCSVRIFPRTVALRLPVFHGMHRFWGSLLLRRRM